jgi:hypothetical protein
MRRPPARTRRLRPSQYAAGKAMVSSQQSSLILTSSVFALRLGERIDG